MIEFKQAIPFDITSMDNSAQQIFTGANDREFSRITAIYVPLSTSQQKLGSILTKIKEETVPIKIFRFDSQFESLFDTFIGNFNAIKENQIKIEYGKASQVYSSHGLFPQVGIIHYPYGKLCIESINLLYEQVRILSVLLKAATDIIFDTLKVEEAGKKDTEETIEVPEQLDDEDEEEEKGDK